MSTRHGKLVKEGIKRTKNAFSFGNVFTNYFLSVLAWGKGDCVFIQLSTLSGVHSLKEAHYRYKPHDLTPD